jgi:AraC-like DNA-binding protein
MPEKQHRHMKTQYIKPKEELADIVDFFYIRKSSQTTEVITQFPALHQELIFNFGDSTEIILNLSKLNLNSSVACLVGTQTKPINLKTGANHYSIGVVYKPWGLYKSFGLRSSTYSNKIVNASALIENRYLKFIADYAKIYAPMEVLSNIESWLIKNNKNYNITDEFKLAFDKYNVSNTQKGAITKVSKDVMLCPKSFIEKFKTIVGVTPIQYLHIKQINNAISAFNHNATTSLTDISNELGFYDQAHFIRVFKSYCAITPGKCRKQVSKLNFQSELLNTVINDVVEFDSKNALSYPNGLLEMV